jgi:hypothetical protein
VIHGRAHYSVNGAGGERRAAGEALQVPARVQRQTAVVLEDAAKAAFGNHGHGGSVLVDLVERATVGASQNDGVAGAVASHVRPARDDRSIAAAAQLLE